jgi:hypothetical protein
MDTEISFSPNIQSLQRIQGRDGLKIGLNYANFKNTGIQDILTKIREPNKKYEAVSNQAKSFRLLLSS